MILVYVITCLRVLHHIYNHQARGRGDYKSDIARVGMLYLIYFPKVKTFVDTSPTFLSSLWRR